MTKANVWNIPSQLQSLFNYFTYQYFSITHCISVKKYLKKVKFQGFRANVDATMQSQFRMGQQLDFVKFFQNLTKFC